MVWDHMNAIIYICHGSRMQQAREQAIAFVHQIMKKADVPIQEMAFLELAEPTIAQAFECCVNQGATTVAVIPILLLTAAHAKEDIPTEIEEQQLRYPYVKVTFGNPIGVNEKMVNLLYERIKETQIPLKDDATVLLVGRGSSDPDVKRDLSLIGERLKHTSNIKNVEVCFLAAASPSLPEGLERVKQFEPKQVFVIPYLFFTGVLMKKIEKVMNEMNYDYDSEWTLCDYLGYHPIIADIFHEQITELLSTGGEN
jgi:sirohydrochlorin ferrochelatase